MYCLLMYAEILVTGTVEQRIYRNINFVDNYDPKYVIVLYHDCRVYDKMLAYHKEKDADCTISVLE